MKYDERMAKLLNAVQDKMPKEVNDWVLANNIIWVFERSYYSNFASCLKIEKDDKVKFIIQAYPNMLRLKFKLQMAAIAHEIAHAYLGHKCNGGEYDIKLYDADELDANILTDKWGFDIKTLLKICNKNAHLKRNLYLKKIF
jgi:hypothetical protein